MPNRIIRERLRICPKLNALKPIEELFFIHLITACDDFGRMDARPEVLKGLIFPLKPRVRTRNISEYLERLAEVGLIELYEVDGAPYLTMRDWEKDQQVRSKRSKYPPNPTQTVDADTDDYDDMVANYIPEYKKMKKG